jgi:hypothetical protein
MINPTWTGVLHAGEEGVATLPGPATATRRGLRRTWGVLCGVSFLAARGSVYLLVLPVTVLASVAGVALYALQALSGGHRG